MSADLEDFDEQINELINSIKSVLEKDMSKLKGQERVEKCQYLRNRTTRAKQVLRSINVEIRGLEKTMQPDWELKAKAYEESIAKLLQDIEWAENTNSAAAAGGKPGQEPPKKKNIDEMTTGDITKHAMMVQDKTQESAARANRALQETIEIGMTANEELKKQGEKIKEIEEGLELVESNLKRADKQIRIFVRRLASDKIFMLLILLMVVAVIGIIAVMILKKNCPAAVQGILCSKPTTT